MYSPNHLLFSSQLYILDELLQKQAAAAKQQPQKQAAATQSAQAAPAAVKQQQAAPAQPKAAAVSSARKRSSIGKILTDEEW